MIPSDLHDFLLATIGASASFIGLLFVALSFTLGAKGESTARIQSKRIRAESSYAALINIFFVSLVALIPDTNIGYVLAVMAITSLLGSYGLSSSRKRKPAVGMTLWLSTITYGVELILGIYLIHKGDAHTIDHYQLMTLIILLFSVALGRAWELTGIHKD